VTITARCHGAAGTLCRGIATLALPTHPSRAPRLLGSRRYLQLAGVTRDLTLYLNAGAIHYLRGKRRVPTILSLEALTAGATPRRSSQRLLLSGNR